MSSLPLVERPVDGGLRAEFEQTRPMPLSGSLLCAAGQLLALVGPSGAGKTSVVRLLAGLMQPQQGRISVAGKVWCDTQQGLFLPAQRRHVGLVFQNYALMPHLDAVGNVALTLLHLPASERQRQAQHWLEHVGLDAEHQARRPASLSGGQQQRVSFARALARQPQLLLLDEPFSAVDQMSRQGLYQLLADLRRELHIPIVLVTHDLNEARMLADRLVVMDAGQVLQTGTPAHIHSAPRNARVADLVGIQNRFRGLWLGPSVTPGHGLLRWTTQPHDEQGAPLLMVRDKGKLPAGHAVNWVIPNDGISLIPAAQAQAGDFRAELVQARHLGEITLATLRVEAAREAQLVLTLTGAERQSLMRGAAVFVRLDAARIHVMPWRGPATPE